MENLSREELNKQAHLLVERAKAVSDVGLLHRSDDLSRVERELKEECRETRARIHQIREECSCLPPVPTFDDEESTQSLQLQFKRLEAELKVWQNQQPNVLSKDSNEVDARQKLTDNIKQLKSTLSTIKEEKTTAEERLKRERELLQQSQEIEQALNEKIAALEGENEGDSPQHEGAEERLRTAEVSCATLKESLESFTEKHISQPSDGKGSSRTNKTTKKGKSRQVTLDSMLNRPSESIEMLPHLAELVQDLISKCLDSPHDPYISVDSVWPPHLQLLLRCGVVQRHPDNPAMIRLTPFHH